MVRQNPKSVFQVLVEAAVTLWTSHQGIKAVRGNDVEGSMRWWDNIRRLASWVAFRFGRLAIYAENKYNTLAHA